MESTILYQDQAAIAGFQRTYESAVIKIQRELDALREYGADLTDNAVMLLLTSKTDFNEWLFGVIENEANSFKHTFMRKQIKEELGVLFDYTNAAHHAIQGILRASPSFPLSVTAFTVKDLKIGLKEGYLQGIIDRHTVYLDTDAKKQAYQLAQEIVGKVDELNVLLKSQGDIALAVGTNHMFNNRHLLSPKDGGLVIQPAQFATIGKTRMK